MVGVTDSNGRHFSGAFPPSARDIVISCDGGPLRQGDEICSFATDVPFNPDDYPRLVTNIGIDHPLCRGRSCIEVMMDIADTVVQIVNSWGGDWHRASGLSE